MNMTDKSTRPVAAAPAAPAKTRVRMIVPIWGRAYIDRWLDFSFAALRSEGNLFYMNEHCDFELALVTKSADAAYMKADSKFRSATAGIRVHFIPMDEFFPLSGKVHYTVPLTLAYGKGILDLGEAGLGTYVILMNADYLVASGSLKSIVVRIQEGYTIISAASLRVMDGSIRNTLESHLDKEAGVLSISPRNMMKLANDNLHSTVTGRIVNDMAPIDSTHFHQIYWRVSDSCLALRGFLIQPLCFRVEQLMPKIISPVDYGFLTECCPEGRFCVITDSDEYLMIELQERHSESHLLRIAPEMRSLRRRLSRLEKEIGANAATWTTRDHRRAATRTILFHESGLPADIARQVAPFEAFVDRILAALPPPVSHIGHFHWIGAVGHFGEEMVRGGSDPTIALLEDPRNMTARTATNSDAQ